jgi:hypothetical protein
MKTICTLFACVGFLVSAVADNLGPQNSRTLLITDATVKEKLSVWQQCGDKAGQWTGKACDEGACVRVNDWFMQCIPAEDPASLTQSRTNELQPWEACNAAYNSKVHSSRHQALHQMLLQPWAVCFESHMKHQRQCYLRFTSYALVVLLNPVLRINSASSSTCTCTSMHAHASITPVNAVQDQQPLSCCTLILFFCCIFPRRSALKATPVCAWMSGTPSADQHKPK